MRQASGNVFTFRELTTLQKWIVERKVTRDDEISLTGESWKRLGNIAELASFFQVVDEAQRASPPAAAAGAAPLPRGPAAEAAPQAPSAQPPPAAPARAGAHTSPPRTWAGRAASRPRSAAAPRRARSPSAARAVPCCGCCCSRCWARAA